MGKSKQVQRTKGNFQPSSSAKAAELVTKTGGSLPGQFFNLSKFLKPQEELDVPYDTDFCYVLKKISKKDINTKRKGLQELGQLCSEKDVEVVAAVLTYFIPHYTKLANDNDRRVREACQECFLNLSGKVKNKLAPHLKDLMATWLMAQCDGHLPSANMARRAFEVLFKESKQAEAVWFCRVEIIKQLSDIMFETNLQSIKDSDVCEADEAEGRLMRLQTSALDALSRFVQLLHPQFSSQIHETLDKLLSNREFWKLHKHATPYIRRAFYDLLSELCDRETFGDDSPYREQASRSVLLCLDESNPHVVPALWRAVVSIFNVKNCWSFVNMNKAFLPKLFTMLDSGGYGCSEMICPNLIVLLDNLPDDVKTDDKFYFRFLSRFRNGLSQSSLMLNFRECNAIVKSFVECCKFIVYNFVENEMQNLASASVVLKDYVVTLLTSALKDAKTTLTCSFKYVAEIVWYTHKMSVKNKTFGDGGDDDDEDKKRHAWMQVFKSAINELAEVSKSLISGEVEDEAVARLTLFYQSFLSFQNESANQNSRQRKIVTFESSGLNKTTACNVNDSSIKSKVEVMEGYKLNESFKEFIHGLSSALFSEIKLKEQWMNRMKLFRMFFERFACEEFLSALKLSKSDGKSGSAIHSFLKEVVCSWMTSADPTLFSDVTSIFLAALTLESEGERMTDLELALSELEEAKDAAGRSKLYKYLSLLFGSSDNRLIELWTRSEKCNESIVSSVIRCVDDFLDGGSHGEAWSMICILLLRNEVNCPVSDARRKILSTIKEYLIYINPSEEKEEQTFVFVESIFSRLNEVDSLDSLKSCEAFDWLLDVLLWATIEPCTTSINSTSRKTLIATLEILLVGEEESDLKDSRLCCLMRSLLMYINGRASRFTDLKEALETSKELMSIVYEHFENFNFFTDFFYVPSVKVYDTEHLADGEVNGTSWLQRLCHLQSHDYSQTRDSIVATQLFCVRLFNSLASLSRNEERVKESDDISAEPTSTAKDEGVVCHDLSSHILRNVNIDTHHVISFINNTLDCIACLTFCDEEFKSTAMIHDGMSALDVLVPSLEDKLNFELIQQRVASCYVSQNEFTLNINSLALFMLLKKIFQMENSYVESMLSEHICGKLIAAKDVSANVVRVVMAMICFVSPAVVGKLFDKFYEVVVNSRLTSEGDLNETFINSFAIINAILKTSEGCRLHFETDSESAADNLKPSAPLFEKIDQARNFCEGFFAEEGKFVEKIGRTNTMVLNFYKNVISKFQIYPDLAEKHWDGILCFAVTRFEDLGSFCSLTDSEFSSELEAFVQSVMSIVLDMSKMFTSKEFVEVSPRLADEWINVFQPTFYEYLNLFFINESKSKSLKHLDVLELLCTVVSQCPPENLDFHRIGLSPVDDDEAEVSFQMLLPLVESPHRYVQVCAYTLMKKLVPKKVEHLKSKFNEDGVDDQASMTSEESDPKPTHPSTFLPSLIDRFEALSTKFKSVDTMPSNDFKEKFSDTYSDLRSYLLIFDLIAETFKSLPIAVKSSLSGWFSDGRVANHMSLLTSVMSKNPSEHLQQVAFDDIDLEISNKKGFDLSVEHETFYSFLGCSSLKEGPVVPRLKVKGNESIVFGNLQNSQEVEQLSFRVFAKTVCAFPRIVRSWYSSLDQRSASQVDKFVTRYVSPFYISKELSEVQQATANQSDLNFQLKTHGRELTALYSADDASIVLSLTFPDNSPLTSLKVNLDHNRITSVKQISSAWTLQLTKLLNFKDGSLMEALMTMSRSIGRHFDGNSCMICYSLILNHQGTKVLPKVQCKTCKNKFHNNCLFTWFKSSNTSNCPLCRSTF